MESEKDTERYLNQEMVKLCGMSFKFTSPMMRGVPDRICIFPNGTVVFVEVKSEGDKPKAHQVRMIKNMRSKHVLVEVIDTKAQADDIIKFYHGETKC